MAKKYDETFAQNNCFKNTFITIESNIQSCSDTKPIPDFNYTMLGHLRTCIHIIASQNIADFNKRSYQEQIIDAVTSMYPELVQPKTAPVLPNNLSREEKYLENAIRNKSSEILDIQTRIDTLNNEYENPGDTSKDIARLEQSNSELKHLEQQLEGLRNRIRFATKEQKTA